MSLYGLILVGGTLVSAFLVLLHLARIKEDGDSLLSAYRTLLANSRRRRIAPPAAAPGESTKP